MAGIPPAPRTRRGCRRQPGQPRGPSARGSNQICNRALSWAASGSRRGRGSSRLAWDCSAWAARSARTLGGAATAWSTTSSVPAGMVQACSVSRWRAVAMSVTVSATSFSTASSAASSLVVHHRTFRSRAAAAACTTAIACRAVSGLPVRTGVTVNGEPARVRVARAVCSGRWSVEVGGRLSAGRGRGHCVRPPCSRRASRESLRGTF